MNKFIFLLFIFFLSCCNGNRQKENNTKSCECVGADGVQVSVPSDIPREKVPGICSKLGGQARNCS